MYLLLAILEMYFYKPVPMNIRCIVSPVITGSIIIVAIACNKSVDSPGPSAAQVAKTNLPVQLNYQCANAPNYGDSIVYMQPTKNDNIIYPVNQAALGKGTYFAWPVGLIIDSVSGAINVSQSETGLRFIVGFTKAGSKDTCVKNLILGGITYADRIYVLSNNDTLAVPYYNANASTPAVCNVSDDNDYPDNSGHGNGDDNCIFDGIDKKGKKGQANAENVKVRTISGVINLKATLAAGAFGNNPVNGTSIIAPIAYSLNDKSKKATQQINVQLIYYAKKTDIPAALVNTITENNAAFFQNTAILKSPRPPIIVVSMFAQ
ncbi:MAG: hypothetical protein ABIR15_16145 [Chitinophagaceae bacterium]